MVSLKDGEIEERTTGGQVHFKVNLSVYCAFFVNSNGRNLIQYTEPFKQNYRAVLLNDTFHYEMQGDTMM